MWSLLGIGCAVGALIGLYIERGLASVFGPVGNPGSVDVVFVLMYTGLGAAVAGTFGVVGRIKWTRPSPRDT